ncbi:uridine phosphorylase 1-like [Coccinella septempunctata]|uniref:uridine phosphorylase 1-like n=1 Tax=Coccinella septempunctata TaxID=41139 RepID=UPI001D08DCB6|nr:uridine phosphorylase 1-like [Coccinella septempunctata]
MNHESPFYICHFLRIKLQFRFNSEVHFIGMESNVYTDGEHSECSERTVQLKNPHLGNMDEDVLYHLALGSKSHDLEEMFGDVKFVCMGGTPSRMKTFAYHIMDVLDYKLPVGAVISEITNYRFSLYKVGPVLSISHGMGVPSIGILLHEIIKLLYHAKAKDPVIFRIGTSGGIGVESGTVVISDNAVDGLGNHFYEVAVLGKIVRRPATFNMELIEQLKSCVDPNDSYETVTGTTMCANDFYEGQGRLDGAICDHSENEKMEYLAQLRERGVVNIEMEATVFAALTHHTGIRAAIVCTTLIDRLQGDQVMVTKDQMEEWQRRPQKLVGEYIKRSLQKKL